MVASSKGFSGIRAEFLQNMVKIQKAVVAVQPQLTVATTGMVASSKGFSGTQVAAQPEDTLSTQVMPGSAVMAGAVPLAGSPSQSLRGPMRGLGGSPSAPNLGTTGSMV